MRGEVKRELCVGVGFGLLVRVLDNKHPRLVRDEVKRGLSVGVGVGLLVKVLDTKHPRLQHVISYHTLPIRVTVP